MKKYKKVTKQKMFNLLYNNYKKPFIPSTHNYPFNILAYHWIRSDSDELIYEGIASAYNKYHRDRDHSVFLLDLIKVAFNNKLTLTDFQKNYLIIS